MDGDFRVDYWRGPWALLNQRVCKITVRDDRNYSERFLRWVLPGYLDAVHRRTSSVTVTHLSSETVKQLPLPLPPRSEQERIVNAIEEQFSRLDAGVAATVRAQHKLKRMRAAALQSAVTTALGCPTSGVRPLAALVKAPLANGRSVRDGPDDGFPVLRLTALNRGVIDVTAVKKGAWTAAEARRYVIQKGDFLVARGNGSKHLVGRGAIVGLDAEVAYPDTLIRLRFDETALSLDYAALIWNSRFIRDQIEGKAKTTAGIYKINQKDLEHLLIPVPSTADQIRITHFVDNMLQAIANTETALVRQLTRSERLRASILAAAFLGRLVCQDSSDEPASVLLERIADERSSNGKKSTSIHKRRTHRDEAPT